MVQRISITNVLTGILLVSFLLVSWAMFSQLSSQSAVVSTSQVTTSTTATSASPYASVPTLSTPVTWNNQTYYIQNSNTQAKMKPGSSLGTGVILGKKAPIASVSGVSSSKEILVAWGAYYYLAVVK